MIHVTNIRTVDTALYDETWAIVRSLKNPSARYKQVPELSPSMELFSLYREMVKQLQWGPDAFKDIYVPRFLKEIQDSEEAHDALNKLVVEDRAGRNIALVCFCTSERLCHRSIIAGLLQGVGCNVQTDTGADYSRYYRMYKQIQPER